MPETIIATVTEPKRTPRPTLTGSIFLSQRGVWVATTTMDGACDPACRGTFTIPGELETERMKRIEEARQMVITRASYAIALAESLGLFSYDGRGM